ncbi:MAG: 2-C-methyl-D-erythritol 4-phosphate cytidylyltransferase, partial [Erysipelotrichaceae bacterium]
MKYQAIVLGGGKGNRADLGYNKILYKMKDGKTVLEKSCDIFLDDEDCEKVIVVLNEELPFNNERVIKTSGGQNRYDSVLNGLKLVESEYVLIHDGARPFVTGDDIDKLKKELLNEDGAILVNKTIDTIKEVRDGYIVSTPERQYLYNALTPQGFRTEVLKEAYENVDFNGVTDDASVLEKYGKKVK